MPEYGGGFTVYSSEQFEEGHGVWYSGWYDPNAKVHEDIWMGLREWVYKGHSFWSESHNVELRESEYHRLFPGIKRQWDPRR